ncbi:MAG TPA: hypothetical protein VK806_02610, partial [Bacteroidia bacterium]|nr:hypothetical protein [Bacteroidia bacterium]
MPKAYRLIILAIFSLSLLQSKAEGRLLSGKDTSKSHSDTTTHIGDHMLKPIIGIGTGVLAYYGNVKPSNSYLQNPLIGRIGYDLSFAMKMTPVVEFNLYTLFGTVAVDERSPTLNWSFQSEIRGGGFHFLFKILPRQPVTPYVLVGFESFEFLSKVDLTNQYGQKYYYWSDGSIRSTAQTAANASSATILYQDYTYESDIRSMDLDGSGKYTEQTYAVPLGAGFMFKVGKKADFMIGTTLHYTFTDHIDGLTPDISGPLKGTTYHDKFLFSSIMLRYDLTSAKNMRDLTDKDEDRYEGVDFDALMNEDNDKDGVRDWDDSCAGTPSGAVVDKKGCPVDEDKDGVPDYRDKQEETPAGSIVNTDGVALTDSMMLRQYQMYVDSTGQFATVQIDSNGITGYHPKNAGANATATRYTVELGHFSKGVPSDVMDKFLSVSDVKSNMMKDSSSVYTAGDYGDYNSAKARQEDLMKLGLTDAKVVYRKGDDFVTADVPVNNGTNPTNVTTTTNPENKTGTNPTNTSTNPENKTGTNPTNVTTTTNPENKTGTNPTNTGTNPENKTGTNPTNVTTTTNPEN